MTRPALRPGILVMMFASLALACNLLATRNPAEPTPPPLPTPQTIAETKPQPLPSPTPSLGVGYTKTRLQPRLDAPLPDAMPFPQDETPLPAVQGQWARYRTMQPPERIAALYDAWLQPAGWQAVVLSPDRYEGLPPGRLWAWNKGGLYFLVAVQPDEAGGIEVALYVMEAR